MFRVLLFALVSILSLIARSEVQVIDGVKWECRDGLCRIVDEPFAGEHGLREATGANGFRVAQGYLSAREFVRFLKGDDSPQEGRMATLMSSSAFWLGLLAILLGGLAMNLTPCVLPMIPINLLVIGKSAARGVWYALGIALAYGTLGVAAAVGGLAFGTIQSSPWFNLAIAIVFILLALALLDVFFIDLSRFRPRLGVAPNADSDSGDRRRGRRRDVISTFLIPFSLGSLSAVLAGACVAPILISVLLLTGKLYAEGKAIALGLPFVFGLGMALPWPFLGAGMKVLPKPGAWMRWVNRLFALLVLAFAVWYGRLAVLGFLPCTTPATVGTDLAATPETFSARLETLRSASSKPILVDCWATWCKNCAAMDRVLEDPEVRKALERFTVIRLQVEDMRKLKTLKSFERIQGLPAFVVF